MKLNTRAEHVKSFFFFRSSWKKRREKQRGRERSIFKLASFIFHSELRGSFLHCYNRKYLKFLERKKNFFNNLLPLPQFFFFSPHFYLFSCSLTFSTLFFFMTASYSSCLIFIFFTCHHINPFARFFFSLFSNFKINRIA